MKKIWIVFFTVLWVTASIADTSYLPEPPDFKQNAEPKKILQNYPLGVITMTAAFAHHGEPQEIILLANGKEGWVYKFWYDKKRTKHRIPSSKLKKSDRELGISNFTLVFDNKKVIDVIYKDDGTGIGVTAMELQITRPDPRAGS
jgi:hypothetical protein